MKNQIYFETMSEALETAFTNATSRGFEVCTDNTYPQAVDYGKSGRENFLLTKDGKLQTKQLHVQFYRMDSGRYELNFYIQ